MKKLELSATLERILHLRFRVLANFDYALGYLTIYEDLETAICWINCYNCNVWSHPFAGRILAGLKKKSDFAV